MRDTGKQKRAFNPKWFDHFTFLHYWEDSDSVICHTCALADKGYTVIISCVFLLPWRKRTFVILSHFKASEMAKSLVLPGAPAPGPLPGLCPGPAGWLTAPPDPQLFSAMTYGHCDSQASLDYARNEPPQTCGNYGPAILIIHGCINIEIVSTITKIMNRDMKVNEITTDGFPA